MLSPTAILRQLRQGEESSTFERLGRSRHVADLRLIFSVTLIIMLAAALSAISFCIFDENISVSDTFTFIGAVGAVGCGVLTWTYQSGSARLGVVDLFACEIATLCRVTAVADAVQHYIELARAIPNDTSRFSSQESYFPVFESTVRDLQQLEEKVVKDVTEFYTYMKVTRDYMRKLADIQPAMQDADGKWRAGIGSVLYMLFLGLESARHSIHELVEFEPTQAEEKITILLSEITAYGYLRRTVTDVLLRRRLEAREAAYRHDVPELIQAAQSGHGPKWEKAKDIAIELQRRYDEFFLDPD